MKVVLGFVLASLTLASGLVSRSSTFKRDINPFNPDGYICDPANPDRWANGYVFDCNLSNRQNLILALGLTTQEDIDYFNEIWDENAKDNPSDMYVPDANAQDRPNVINPFNPDGYACDPANPDVWANGYVFDCSKSNRENLILALGLKTQEEIDYYNNLWDENAKA